MCCLVRLIFTLLVFHAALIIGAALQVHETQIALVTLPDCDGTYDYVVRLSTLMPSLNPFTDVIPFRTVGVPERYGSKLDPSLSSHLASFR